MSVAFVVGGRYIEHTFAPLSLPVNSIKDTGIKQLIHGEAKVAQEDNFVTIVLDYGRWQVLWAIAKAVRMGVAGEYALLDELIEQLEFTLAHGRGVAYIRVKMPEITYHFISALVDVITEEE